MRLDRKGVIAALTSSADRQIEVVGWSESGALSSQERNPVIDARCGQRVDESLGANRHSGETLNPHYDAFQIGGKIVRGYGITGESLRR